MSYLQALAILTSWRKCLPGFLKAKVHRSILSSVWRLVEFSQTASWTFKARSCLAFFAATLTPAASAAPLKQMRPEENKADRPGGGGGVNNTHLEVCRSVARCDTLKAHLASMR